MAVNSLAKTRRITVPVLDDQVVIIVKEPSGAQRSDFLTSRFEMRGRKVKSNMTDARVKFIRPLLLDVENAAFENAAGEMVDLNKNTVLTDADKVHCATLLGYPVNDWKDLVNVSWLSSAAQAFEDAAPEGN